MYISTTTSITFVWIMLLRYTTSGQKIDVTIPIMMPYLYKHKNTVNRAINTVQNSIYVRRMGILTKYKPKLKPVIFYRDSPDEILQIFNKTIMEEQVNTAIYIQYKEDDKAMASADYTVSLLEELGVPVLSWDPNYTGSLEVRLQLPIDFGVDIFHAIIFHILEFMLAYTVQSLTIQRYVLLQFDHQPTRILNYLAFQSFDFERTR